MPTDAAPRLLIVEEVGADFEVCLAILRRSKLGSQDAQDPAGGEFDKLFSSGEAESISGNLACERFLRHTRPRYRASCS